MTNKRILLIDGDWFANRTIFGIQIRQPEFNLDTGREQEEFRIALRNGLLGIYRTFSNENYSIIDNLVFVADNHSWRKDVEPYRPYYLKNDKETPIGYKANREELREKSNINWDNYRLVYDDFVREIQEFLHVVKVRGYEGDDALLMTTRKLKELGIESLILCTDGDIPQMVNDKVFVYRNIRSKEAPNGEFVISPNLYRKVFGVDEISTLMGTSTDIQEYVKIFGLILSSEEVTQRTYGAGIEYAAPSKIALVKSITGDKKDNIFPIFRWKATTGTKNFKVTEGHLEKALIKLGRKLTNVDCHAVLADEKLQEALINELARVTKQESSLDLYHDSIIKHLKHNFRMIILSPNLLPKDSTEEFEVCFQSMSEDLCNNKFSALDMLKRFGGVSALSDKPNDIMKTSAPTVLVESSGLMDEIDEIANS